MAIPIFGLHFSFIECRGKNCVFWNFQRFCTACNFQDTINIYPLIDYLLNADEPGFKNSITQLSSAFKSWHKPEMAHGNLHFWISWNNTYYRNAGVVLDCFFCLFSMTAASNVVENNSCNLHIRVEVFVSVDESSTRTSNALCIDYQDYWTIEYLCDLSSASKVT